ncbi:hypothetical protein HanXRQr2_Chr04g0156961 [Helianthus annuus]|uniref:Uncharacterized protein n=1 Tax=Helianthus annuus TaxID=4232 RepID=A0A9K3NR11_HELAN|nr:hypothetical protein HanXRQr2_Chr04g0156961 [Helianthus annuus]KAJ0580415.1 hypothetical protein HanHA300_Chr04g0128981 [Helianthus annuus]KAJ0596373.1 hypothetical protein HanHA89_Chr04g0142031 [Helianthus annuus]
MSSVPNRYRNRKYRYRKYRYRKSPKVGTGTEYTRFGTVWYRYGSVPSKVGTESVPKTYLVR